MAGKHRYEPEGHRATWLPAVENVEPLLLDPGGADPVASEPEASDPWWSRFRRTASGD